MERKAGSHAGKSAGSEVLSSTTVSELSTNQQLPTKTAFDDTKVANHVRLRISFIADQDKIV
jgi:hypothetical protein